MPSFLTDGTKPRLALNTELLMPGRAQYYPIKSHDESQPDKIVVVGCSEDDRETYIYYFDAPLYIDGETELEQKERFRHNCTPEKCIATLGHDKHYTMQFNNRGAKVILGIITVRHFVCMSPNTSIS